MAAGTVSPERDSAGTGGPLRSSDITVGVATCGRPEALAACLAALSAQTAAAGDVVVVDQAPSDAARAAVAAAGLAQVRYVEQARLGLSASRNLALRSASQRVLAVTDDDCVPDPGWLAAVAAALSRSPRPDAVSGAILPLGEGAAGSYAFSLRESSSPVDHRGRVLPWDVGSGANFAAPVDAILRAGGWDERLGAGSPGRAAEDSDLLYRLLLDGATVRYEPSAVIRHAWHTRARRMATRWSYGYGIGAMCGLWLARRDPFAPRMLLGYARLHLRPLLGAARHRDRGRAEEHARALGSLLPGLAYGLSARRRQSTTSATAP